MLWDSVFFYTHMGTSSTVLFFPFTFIKNNGERCNLEVKNKLQLVLQLQQYCNKWMSDDYLFVVVLVHKGDRSDYSLRLNLPFNSPYALLADHVLKNILKN